MECRRHQTGPGSDQIPRRQRRTGVVRDNQADLDCGTGRPGESRRVYAPGTEREGAEGDDDPGDADRAGVGQSPLSEDYDWSADIAKLPMPVLLVFADNDSI